MSVIIDTKKYLTNGVSVSIPYDINQLDLSGARIQVKFDTKIVGGVGSKFSIRHSDSAYKGLEGTTSPIMESSIKGASHIFTVDLTDDIIQNSKRLTVTSNGGAGTDSIELEVTNIEIRVLEHVQVNDSLFALKTYQMVKKGLSNGGNSGGGGEVVVLNSKQTKPAISEIGELLLEEDTGKVFYYDGTEWREFV